MNITLEQIIEDAPLCDGKKTAFFSMCCLWWTTHHEDIAQTPPLIWHLEDPILPAIVDPLGEVCTCCPHCGCTLMNSPLEEFIAGAKAHPENFGKYGLESLALAHSRNISKCFHDWEDYELLIDLKREVSQ
jgi:hypothetical protein